MLPYLQRYDWLYNYQFFDGMESVLDGMNKRTKLISKMDLAINDLKEHHSLFERDFNSFFKDLINFVKVKKEEI